MSDITRPQPVGLVGSVIRAVGHFWPTRRLALLAFNAAFRGGLLPRFVRGTVNGRQLDLDLAEMVDFKIWLYGAFDQRGLQMMGRLMEAVHCRTALDIGANIGNHTAYFVDRARQVYAFEPSPPIFARLARLIAENRLANATAIECGLSDKEAVLTFYNAPGQAHLGSFLAEPGMVASGTAPVRRGDDVVAERAIRDVDFIKIDIEGFEFEALRGLKATIERDRPLIVMEFMMSSIAKFGSIGELEAALPGYAIMGTRKSVKSRLFKTALTVEPFIFGKAYLHLICVPAERKDSVAPLVRTGDV